MLDIVYSHKYKKARKKLNKEDLSLIDGVVFSLASGKKLEQKYRDHALGGKYLGFRDCHIKPDLVLIYRIYDDILELYLAALGSHADLGF